MLQIIDYSEKAIAVIGTERGNNEQLTAMKAMKGKWNRGLTCGAGWVFSKRKNGEEVTKWVSMWNAAHPDSAPAQPSAPQIPAQPKSQPTPAPQAVTIPQAQTPAPAAPIAQAPPIIIEDERGNFVWEK